MRDFGTDMSVAEILAGALGGRLSSGRRGRGVCFRPRTSPFDFTEIILCLRKLRIID